MYENEDGFTRSLLNSYIQDIFQRHRLYSFLRLSVTDHNVLTI